MKILLAAINSKYIHTSPAADSLLAFVSAKSVPAGSLSFSINQPEEQILGSLYLEDADIYCFSVYIWNCSLVYRLSRELKALKPGIQIWYGGPEVSFQSTRLMKEHAQISGIMRGEGEETFSELVRLWNRPDKETAFPIRGNLNTGNGNLKSDESSGPREELTDISGITWRNKNGEICKNPDREPMDPDRLVFPYHSAVPDMNRIYYYESSRGCPFSCSYCLSSIDKTLRFKSLNTVYKDLEWFLENRIRQVKFVDRTFNIDGKSRKEKKTATADTDEPRYLKIWKYLKKHDNGVTNFHFEICGELLKEEELIFLKTLRPGQVQFEIGVQTVNPETLAAIHRYRDEKCLRINVKSLLEGKNIHIHLDLIAGLPFENLQSFRRSFDEVYFMNPLKLQLGFLKILKGTPMETFAKENRFIWQQEPPFEILSNPWLSYKDILVLKETEEMLEVYYNSHQFEHTLNQLISYYASPFELFYRIAEFYKKTGNDRMDHSRMKRYEILMSFIREEGSFRTQINAEEFIPLLLDDAVSRERLKHWPEWAGNYKKTDSYDYDRRDPLTGNALRLL